MTKITSACLYFTSLKHPWVLENVDAFHVIYFVDSFYFFRFFKISNNCEY